MSRAQAVTPIDLPTFDYSVRDYQQADEEAVLRLLHAALGQGRGFVRDATFWRWKHFDNPSGPSQILLAANEDVLGLRAFLQWTFRTPAGQLRAVRAVDTSTHPLYRRRRVFLRLTELSVQRARDDGVDLIFNTPNPQSMAGYLKLGWQRVGRPRLLAYILRPTRIASVLVRGGRMRFFDPSFPVPGLRPVSDLLTREKRLQTLLSADDANHAGSIRTMRTVEFLRWRYALAPSLPYGAIWTDGTRLDAAVIVRANTRRGLRELMVVEVLLGGGIGELINLTQRLASSAPADYLVAAAVPGTPHWVALRKAGFLPLPGWLGPTLTVLPLHPGLWQPEITRLLNWQLSLGDLEIF